MKKYVLFTIGVVVSFFGFVTFVVISMEMTTAPKNSPLAYAVFMVLFGFLPFISGIALCVFAVRKWLKKWWNSRRDKRKHLGAEVGEEKPVDPATAALNRRANRIGIVSTIVTVIIGIVVVLKLSNWFAGLIGIPSVWVLPIFILPVIVCAILGTKLYKKKFSKTSRKISDKIVEKMFKDKR